MAQRLPVQRINTGPQALRYAQRLLKQPTYVVAAPSVSTVTATWDSFNAAVWYKGAGATVANGVLSLAVNSSYTGTANTIAASKYDFTNASYSCQVIQMPNVGNGGTEFFFEVLNDGTGAQGHSFYWNNGTLNAVTTTSQYPTRNYLWSGAYDSYKHQFLRIREYAGLVYWEVSADYSTWTTVATSAPVFSMSAGQPSMTAGYWGTEPSPGVAIIDNINLAPSQPFSNPVRPVSRKTGPMALRQIIRHRPQPSSPPSVSPSAKIATFTETFNTLDPTIWATVSGTPSSTYGQLTLPCASTYSTVQSVASFDLTDSSVYVNLTQVQAAGNGTTDTIFGVTSNNGQYVWFQVANSQLITLDTTTGSTTTRPYDPIAHQFLRIRANGSGTMWWDCSPDASTWTQLATSTGSGLSVGNAQVYFSCGYDGVEDNPLPAMFTDLNLPPSLPTRTAVIPVSRKTGPMALRRRIMRRQQSVYPTRANGYIIDASLTVTAAPTGGITVDQFIDATQTISAATSLDSATVTYDATGTGANSGAGTTTSLSWTHTATAGADVFAIFSHSAGGGVVTSVTYGGTAMELVGNISVNNDSNTAITFVYRLTNAPSGTKTVTATWTGGAYASANSVSYLNVGPLGMIGTSGAYGNGLTASQTVTTTDSQALILNVQSHYCGGVDTFVSSSGGTQRSQILPSSKYMNQVIQDSTSSATFTSTVTTTNTYWGSFSLVLRPTPASATHVKTVELLSRGAGQGANSSTMSWTHNIESDANLLVVAINWQSQAWYPTCTVNGLSMTEAWAAPAYNIYLGWYAVTTFYYYRNPPAGTQTITYQGAPGGAYMSAQSFTFRNAGGIGTPVSVPVNSSNTVSKGPNDFLLNAIGGWGQGGGFGGYSQNPLWHYNGSNVANPLLVGYAKASATFSVTDFPTNYGGYGNVVLPIQPMVDIIADSTLAVTETQTAIRTAATFPAALAITASPSSAAQKGRVADSLLQIGPSTTSKLVRNFVAYESTGAGSSANGATVTWTHTIGATANCLIVGCVSATTFSGNVPTAKVGSTYLKLLGMSYWDTNRFTLIWGLMNPPTGSQTITVTGATSYTGANSVAYSGVGGFSAPTYATGSGTSISAPVSGGVEGGLIVQVLGNNSTGSLFTNYNQTARVNIRLTSMYGLLIGDNATQPDDNTSVTFTATEASAWPWGSASVVLYPTASPPTGVYYDAIGHGWGASTATNWTVEHVATAGAYAFVDIAVDRAASLTNVLYDGNAMTSMGVAHFTGVSGQQASLYRYMYGPVAGGHANITGTFSGATWNAINSVSYLGVGMTKALQIDNADGSSPSQTVSCSAGQIIVEAIGIWSTVPTAPSGGSNLFDWGNTYMGLVVNQATTSTTFATADSGVNWGAVATVLDGPTSADLAVTFDATDPPFFANAAAWFADSPLQITATPTGIGVRNANVDVAQTITASRTSNVTWTTTADVAQTITASPTSIGSYGAVAAVAQAITANRPANVTWQLKANVTQPITTTITADSLRTAQVNATLPVTASPTSNVTWVLAANVAQTITATLQASELRLVNVDAAMPVTVGRLGTGNVAYDSTGVGATNSAAGGFTLSWNHTIGATANYVVMAISHLTNGASTYTAKCGGVTMTLLGITLNYQTSPGPHSTYVYGLANPPTGTQSMTFQTSANYNYVAGNSVAYSGVGSVAGVFTQSLVGNASFSQTVPSLSNQMLFNAWASDGLARTTAPSYSQTQRSWLPEVDNINPLLFIGDAAGTGSPVTFSGTANASGNWGGVTIALSPLGPTAVTGIRGDVTEAITATLTTTYLRNAIVNATQQIIADRTGAIVVDLHGNATLPVTTTATGAGVRNAMVDSTIAVTASRTANSNWYAYADATQTITPRGLGLETVSPPTWVGTGPGKAQGTSPLTFTDSIPVGTTYTLLFGQLLCASATLPTITTTIGGQSATLVDSVYASPTGGNYLYGFCFALANPPTGSQTVTFTSNSNDGGETWLTCAVNTVHYSGVGSLGPVSKIGQQAGQPSFSVGTDAKYGYAQAFLYAAAAAGNGFSSYNQNQRWTASRWGRPLLIGDATGNGGTLTFSATRDNTTNGWGAIVVPLAPVSAGAIYGATAATALPITATRLANVTWAAKAAALQQVTASPAAEYSRGQPVGLNVVASATQSITAIPDSTGSRGQTVESTETITVSTDAIGSRGQDIDSPLVVTADLLSMVTWQGWFDAAQVITASDTANAIWALRANAAQQITASYTALASYGATGNALLPITASPLLSNVIWDAQALSDLIVTASTPTIGSRWQPIDSTQAITALLSGIGSRGQFVDSTLGLTIAALPAAISYGATGNAPLVITVNLLTSDTLLDNHAYAALVVNAGRPTSVIWDTRADSRLTVTTHFWATFGRLLNVDANLTVVTRLTAALRAVFLSNASLGIVAGLPTKLSRWQPIDSTQAITATPAGGIVWHGRIGAPLRITATPLGNAIWDAHANSQMTVTESGLIVVSRGQDIDPALDITADTSGEFTQTMSGDVEQAILALPDTELSLGSTMDSALSLIVTYSADIGEALRGGNFFYFYL